MNKKTRILLFMFFLVMILLITFIVFYALEKQQENKLINYAIPSNGSLQLYACPFDDCETILYNTLMKAHNIKCAFYNLNNEKIEKALALKNTSLVIDCNNLKQKNYKVTPNLDCVKHYKAIMHDKFCVLDHNFVITGSFNPSTSLNKDYNALLIINSTAIAGLYNQEFEELQQHKKNKKSDYNKINLSGVLIEVYFCPEDNCQQALINTLDKANNSIRFMTYSFTDKAIAMQLIAMSNKLIVQGVLESQQLSKYSVFKLLKDFNITVFIEKSPRLMHHKSFIIDDRIATIGSYNPTLSGAFKNDENMVIIHDNSSVKKLIGAFKKIVNLTQQ